MSSEKIAVLSLLLAAILVGLVWWIFDPDLPWWGFLILFMVAAGGLFSRLVRDLGHAKIVDSDKL